MLLDMLSNMLHKACQHQLAVTCTKTQRILYRMPRPVMGQYHTPANMHAYALQCGHSLQHSDKPLAPFACAVLGVRVRHVVLTATVAAVAGVLLQHTI